MFFVILTSQSANFNHARPSLLRIIMTINSGGNTSNIRRNSRNYITDQAQARLDEILPSIQQQGLNALAVDSTPILYYSRVRGGYTCTCCATEIVAVDLDDDPVTEIEIQHTLLPFGKPNTSIFTKSKKPLFGERAEFTTQEDLDDNPEDWLIQNDPELTGSSGTTGSMFSGTIDCGICYRTGYVPGFQLANRTRLVLTTHNLTNLEGYTINRASQPHVFESLVPNSKIEFEIKLPKYFKNIYYGLRNNHEEVYQNVLLNGVPLNKAVAIANQGKTVLISVGNVDKFTHIVLEFEHDMPLLNANISQISRSTDYTNFDPIGNITVYIPMTLNRVEAGEIIYADQKKIYLKVIDVTYNQTAKNVHTEWSASCRVLQPTEPMKSIVLTRKV